MGISLHIIPFVSDALVAIVPFFSAWYVRDRRHSWASNTVLTFTMCVLYEVRTEAEGRVEHQDGCHGYQMWLAANEAKHEY
jgi:hypothetical protein